ncbi:MAG: hypothetical protein FJZ16_06665 [Candidatus Omnitrophica bacterium]|nr:hypothetical protein [Candidatus Omnitrophota bacterium]
MKKIIISKFREKPKTKTAWRAMWLGFSVLLIPPFLGVFAAVIRPIIDKESMEGREGFDLGAGMGFGAGLVALILTFFALKTCIQAYRQGERSWALWVGFVPAILVGAFWIFMIIGEFLFPH